MSNYRRQQDVLHIGRQDGQDKFRDAMHIVATSDFHGTLPMNLPACDVLVIAGDIIPTHEALHPSRSTAWMTNCERWLETQYIPWLQTLKATHIVQTWGNHDWWASAPTLLNSLQWPSNVHCLDETSVTLEADNGVVNTFYGQPYTPIFFNWAFMYPDTSEGLGRVWEKVPDDVDVVVTHGPPSGACDHTTSGFRAGSKMQLQWLERQSYTRLIVCGHIHEGYGNATRKNVTIVNAALKDVKYQPIQAPVEIFLYNR